MFLADLKSKVEGSKFPLIRSREREPRKLNEFFQIPEFGKFPRSETGAMVSENRPNAV